MQWISQMQLAVMSRKKLYKKLFIHRTSIKTEFKHRVRPTSKLKSEKTGLYSLLYLVFWQNHFLRDAQEVLLEVLAQLVQDLDGQVVVLEKAGPDNVITFAHHSWTAVERMAQDIGVVGFRSCRLLLLSSLSHQQCILNWIICAAWGESSLICTDWAKKQLHKAQWTNNFQVLTPNRWTTTFYFFSFQPCHCQDPTPTST